MSSGKEYSIRSQAGFTLLEMIVAVTLVAMMAVGLWAVFRISLRSWSRGTEFMDANQRHRSILNLVRKQMASTYGLFIQDPLQPGTPVLMFDGTENSLQFISLNSLQFNESPGLTWVSYELSQDKAGDYSLVERETRYLGQMPDEGGGQTASTPIPIFENLSSCLFEYFDPGDAGNASQWVREWDGQKQRKLPLAVSVTMVSHDPKGNSLSRHMVVPIKSEPYDVRYNYMNPLGNRGRTR
jgi:prepilin-type N-terminal cleavage/methylation domain-containing protein